MSDWKLESHDDDTVTVTYGDYQAHIVGRTWRDARDAAMMLVAALEGRKSVEQMRLSTARILQEVQGLQAAVTDVAEAAREVEKHVHNELERMK